MKEILKHYEPPFKAQYVFPTGLAYVVDASGNSLAKVWDDNSIAQEIAAALNKAARIETLDELTQFSQKIGMYDSVDDSKLERFGQIEKGQIIEYTRKDGEIKESRVKEVLHAGTEREEVIINRRKNHYFITKMVLDGTSWARDVRIKAIPL